MAAGAGVGAQRADYFGKWILGGGEGWGLCRGFGRGREAGVGGGRYIEAMEAMARRSGVGRGARAAAAARGLEREGPGEFGGRWNSYGPGTPFGKRVNPSLSLALALDSQAGHDSNLLE